MVSPRFALFVHTLLQLSALMVFAFELVYPELGPLNVRSALLQSCAVGQVPLLLLGVLGLAARERSERRLAIRAACSYHVALVLWVLVRFSLHAYVPGPGDSNLGRFVVAMAVRLLFYFRTDSKDGQKDARTW
jgi:hypothetical protein